MRNLFKFNRSYLVKELKSVTANTFISAVLIMLYVLGQVAAFILGFHLLRTGVLTTGAVYVVIYYTHFVFMRLSQVAFQIQDLQQAVAGIKRVQKLFDLKSKITNADNPTILPPGPLAVIFDHVTFGYNGSDAVLRDVSFRLEPGKTLGLLGRTGSGKTTITRLIFRLYDSVQGTIQLGVNGKSEGRQLTTCSISHLALDDVRRRIGLVTQNVQLFHAPVRDNITLFDHRISDTKILRALAELGLSGWCEALPKGLDTLVSSEGGNFSAGEAQLLAFARVFLNDPDMVILDEASSRLDPVTEKRVQKATDALLENRTGIIIAHRLRTVEQVDQIMIIEGGQILESGEYTSLSTDPASQFYQLLQTGLEEVLR
jgi:ABC-type multidrug transport system fused ATPase/permease subunit